MNPEQYMNLIYHKRGNPAFMSGETALYRETKKKFPKVIRKDVVKFLKKLQSYNLHTEAPKKVNKVHPKFITTTPFQSVSCDLAFFAKNKLVYLMCIDDHSGLKFSEFAGNRKTANSTKRALEKIFSRMPRMPMRLRVDKGREFSSLKSFLASKKIAFSQLDSYQKAYNAEAFIGQLRKIYRRYQTYSGKKDIRPIIQSIVTSMNKKRNRVTGLTPIEASKMQNAGQVFEKRFSKHLEKMRENYDVSKIAKFPLNSKVRVISYRNASEEKSLLKKGPRYSSTIFTVYKQVNGSFPIQYMLKDDKGVVINRRFIERHLVSVNE